MANVNHFSIPQGNVEILELIGSGRFSQVFGAKLRDSQGNTCNAAAKKIKANGIEDGEVAVLKQLNHKNIIKFYGVYICERDEHFIIMELAARKDLRYFLTAYKNGKPAPVRLPISLVWKWVIEAASALQYLHSLNHTHRDIKSLNYLVMFDFTLKLSDLGLAKELFQTSKTKRGGTCQWMAPEVIEHQLRSPKSDVFSYGVVVWEILSTEIPYAEIKSEYNIMSAICDGKRPVISEDCVPELKHLMECCWVKDHNQRPSMNDIYSELEKRKAAGLPDFSPQEVDLQVRSTMGPPSTVGARPETHEMVDLSSSGFLSHDVDMKTASPFGSRDLVDFGPKGAGGDASSQASIPGAASHNPHQQVHQEPRQPFRFPSQAPQQFNLQQSPPSSSPGSSQPTSTHYHQPYCQSPVQDTTAHGMLASGVFSPQYAAPPQQPHQSPYGYSALHSQDGSGAQRVSSPASPPVRSIEVVLNDLFLMELAGDIGREFTQLAISLEFTLPQSERFKMESQFSLSDAILKMLVKWRQKQDRRQTTREVVEKLAQAFVNVDRHDLAGKVRDLQC